MTFQVIEDIVTKYPEVIENDNLVLRSDNCASQYKSKFVFSHMKELAAKYQIRVSWFYGEPGHGRGLVDAMSSFGCKGPLRMSIITENNWFDTANESIYKLSFKMMKVNIIT